MALTGDGRGRGGPSPPEASTPQREEPPTRLSRNLGFRRNSPRSRNEAGALSLNPTYIKKANLNDR